MMSVAMFGTALPIKKALVLMHFDVVYTLSQKPFIGLHENIETRTMAIHHAMTVKVMMFAMSLKWRTEKIRRYKESTESLIARMEVP